MAKISMYDPLTSEARSPLIAGLTEACNKLSSILDLKTSELHDLPLSPIFVSETDKYRIYQAPLGNKLWLETPAPIIKKNGIVITPSSDEFTIDYFGGSISFDNNKQLTEFDFVTADVTCIIDESNKIESLISDITKIGASAKKYRGYYNDFTSLQSLVENPSSGDFAIVGGTDNSIYIWNVTAQKWENTFKVTDLSDYYTKSETDELLDEKENTISQQGTTTSSDNYYYGGRKTWQNVNDKVRNTSLNGFDDSEKNKVTKSDTVLSAVGKLQGQINDYIHDLFGTGAPTTTTAGKIGQDYTNTSTGEKFWLKEIDVDDKYIWVSYQTKLTFDNQPTENSNNILSSGVIYESLEEKLDKSGGTMTGFLKVQSPTDDDDATTKSYVDNSLEEMSESILETMNTAINNAIDEAITGAIQEEYYGIDSET